MTPVMWCLDSSSIII